MENTQSELSQIIEYRNLKKFAQLILNENKKCIDAVLLAVVQAGWFQGVEFLLKETNASIQEVTPSKNTALHFAAREGNVEIIQILLKFGSEVSSRNSAQQTPVMYAATAGNFAALQKLLQIKQDIQAIDASGRSALDLSCVGALNAQGEDEDDDSSSYAQCVQALLTAGSHPKNALSLVRDALPKIQSEKKQHLVGRILHMLETSMNQFDQEAARNAQLLLEEEINERNRTPPTTTNSKRRIKKQKKKIEKNHSVPNTSTRQMTTHQTTFQENKIEQPSSSTIQHIHVEDSDDESQQWFTVDRKFKGRRAHIALTDHTIADALPRVTTDITQSQKERQEEKNDDKSNIEQCVNQMYETCDQQHLFETLFPEASLLALRVEDILLPTTNLSASQLEAAHDILDKCIRRVVEARILLAIQKEKSALQEALHIASSKFKTDSCTY